MFDASRKVLSPSVAIRTARIELKGKPLPRPGLIFDMRSKASTSTNRGKATSTLASIFNNVLSMSVLMLINRPVRTRSELPLSTHPVAGPTHTVPDVNVGFGLTAVMGRMFTSGSNAQIVNFAKYRANSGMVNVPGPKLPFTQALDAVAQLPRSGHSSRYEAFCYAR